MNIVKLEQGSQQWLEFRRNGVGASDIASIAGIEGAFQKRKDVMAEKLGRERKLTEYQEQIFRAGHEWEQVVRAAFLREQGFKWEQAVATHIHNDRFFASLDGLDLKRGTILEVKSVVNRAKFEQCKAQTPPHYLAQVQWQLYCTGLSRAFIAFVHEGEVYSKEIHAAPEAQAMLSDQAAEFLFELDMIRMNEAPAPIQAVGGHEIKRLAHLKRAQAEMRIQMDVIDEEIRAISERILAETKASRVESDEISIAWQERQGSISYTKIPEVQKLGESYLNSFRGKSIKSIIIKLK